MAHNISAGSPLGDEDSQRLTFSVSLAGGAAALFAGEGGEFPKLSRDGVLTFVPAAYEHGAVTLNVTLLDDGGVERGGRADSVARAVEIVVLDVNDQPSFDMLGLVSVWEDQVDIEVGSVCFNIDRGSPNGNEDYQEVSFFLELIDGDASLFSDFDSFNASSDSDSFTDSGVGPVELSSNGTLTFTLAPSANGNATFSVTMVDSGGTARGGENTAAVKNLTINVASVNDRPAFVVGDVTVYQAQGNVSIANFASGIARGDNGNEEEQRLSFTVKHRLDHPLSM